MMDSLRKGTEDIGEKNCKSVLCEKCPLYEKTCFLDSESYGEQCDYNCFETVKIVYDWAKEHPVKTNLDKLEEVFGVEVAEYIITDGKQKTREYKFSNKENKTIRLNSLSLEDTSFSEWLDEKYKEEKQND